MNCDKCGIHINNWDKYHVGKTGKILCDICYLALLAVYSLRSRI